MKRVLQKFNMSECHPLNTPKVVRSLEVNKDPFRPKEEDEETLGTEVPYLSTIGALKYLTNCTRPYIAFVVNLLARYSAAPIRRHWVGVKTILRYLKGTQDLGLWFPKRGTKVWWVMLMLAICLTPIMLDHILVLCFSVVV
jgi:hypothetical protein